MYSKDGTNPAALQADLNRAVAEAFNAAEVQIMTPFNTADPKSLNYVSPADKFNECVASIG